MPDITIPSQEVRWSHNFDVGRPTPPTLIVIHSTRGKAATLEAEYEAAVNFMAGPNSNSNASAHYAVGPTRCCRMVHDKDRSWNARYLNDRDLGIEIAQPTVDTPYTETEYQLTARIVAAWCVEYPQIVCKHVTSEDDHGYIGHDETAQGKSEGKSDPGHMWDWNHFDVLVAAEYHRLTAPVPPPIIHGPNIPAITAATLALNQATGKQEPIGSGYAALLNSDKSLGAIWFVTDLVVPGAQPDKCLYLHPTTGHPWGRMIVWRRGPNECKVLW